MSYFEEDDLSAKIRHYLPDLKMTTAETENNATAANGAEKKVSAEDLEWQIIRQVEHYFGDYNLPRDKFLREQTEQNEGWIGMDTMLKFKRLASLSSDEAVILSAIAKSDTGLLEVDTEAKKIRRKPDIPVPEWNDERRKELEKQTVYAKGFDKENSTLDDLLVFFKDNSGSEWKNVMNVQMRMYTDKKKNTKGFKGSVFVTFKDVESAEKFLKQEGLKVKDQEITSKWQSEYFAEKSNEYLEKKNAKKEKAKKDDKKESEDKKEGEEEKKEEFVLPKGSVLVIKELGEEVKREDLKSELEAQFQTEPTSIAFIYYNKGEPLAKLRFKEENAAVDLLAKIKEKGEVKISDKVAEFSVLEGQEEQDFLDQCVEDMKKHRGNQNRGRGHKRRGGFGGGRGGKRGRRN